MSELNQFMPVEVVVGSDVAQNSRRGADLLRRSYGLAIRLTVAALLVAIVGTLTSAQATAQSAVQETDDVTPVCRLGVNAIAGSFGPGVAPLDVTSLRMGWYIDYLALANPARPNGAEYAPMIRLRGFDDDNDGVQDRYSYTPRGQTLRDAIDGNPGADWFIGNEPDRLQFQDDVQPHIYAQAYHELYELITQRDPSAKIFAGSIVQATEVRLKYLDMVLAAYEAEYGERMPVDGWSIHGFILNEVSCARNPFPPADIGCWGADIPPGLDDAFGMVLDELDGISNDGIQKTDDMDIFKANILRFRQWMAQNGYRNVPLYLSEYGVLMPSKWYPEFSVTRVNNFMNATFDYLMGPETVDATLGYPADGNRLVQRLSWYSTTDEDSHNGHLFDSETYARSPMGDNYATYAATIADETDIFPTKITISPSVVLSGTENVTYTLTAQIANSGNLLAAQGVLVRFYNGDPGDGGVQIGEDQAVAVGGCGETVMVSIQWTDDGATAAALSAGPSFYVQVSPGPGVEDVDTTNNQVGRSVFVATDEVRLPLTSLQR